MNQVRFVLGLLPRQSYGLWTPCGVIDVLRSDSDADSDFASDFSGDEL